MIGKVQWLISLATLIYGIALLKGFGTTGFLFVGIGLLYCGLAAIASRRTIIPVLLALLADCLLAFMSWRMLTGAIEAVPANAGFQGRRVMLSDYLTLDAVASAVILVLVVIYISTVAFNWKLMTNKGWL